MTRHSFIYITFALMQALFVGCSNDDDDTINRNHQLSTVPITLSTSTTGDTSTTCDTSTSALKSASRSTNNSFQTMQADNGGFSLYTFFTDGHNYMNGVNYAYKETTEAWGSKTNGWVADETYYWPTPPQLDFYALYPAAAPNDSIKYDKVVSSQTVHVGLHDEVENGTWKNHDILYASSPGYDASSTADWSGTYQAVPLNFKHMLSQIQFKLKTGNYKVVIKTVSAYNLLQYGDFNLKTETWTLQDWSKIEKKTQWRVKQYANGSYKEISNDWSGTAINDGDDEAFFVLPNTLPKWDPANDGKAFEKGKRYRGNVGITCFVYDSSGKQLWPAKGNDPKELYIPFGGTWVAGKRHIVTLDINDAWDDNDKASTKIQKVIKSTTY